MHTPESITKTPGICLSSTQNTERRYRGVGSNFALVRQKRGGEDALVITMNFELNHRL